MCRKCVAECPTGAIHAVNFPPAKPKAEVPVEQKVETVQVQTNNNTEEKGVQE